MFKKIHIRDYRSCVGTSFEPHPSLSVLIGPNSSGKTNILQAVMLLQRILEMESGQYRMSIETPTIQSHLTAAFGFKDLSATFQTTVGTYTDEQNTDVVVYSRDRWRINVGKRGVIKSSAPLVLGFSEKQLPLFFANPPRYLSVYRRMRQDLHQVKPQTIRAISSVAQFIAGLKYYGASQFTNPSNCPVSFEIEKEGERRYPGRIRGHARFLYDLYRESHASNNKKYREFLDIVGPRGLCLVDRIAFKEITTSSIDYSVRSGGKVEKRRKTKNLVIPRFIKGRHDLSPNQLSEGTFKTVVLLFHLMTETSSAMLIEEPEVCIHHGLLASILELIKNYAKERQIILSTHSDYVLDKVAPENVYRVTIDDDRGTIVRNIKKSMSAREFRALREYLDTVGNLGDYWRSGPLEN